MKTTIKYLTLAIALLLLMALNASRATPVAAAGGPPYDGNYGSTIFVQNASGFNSTCAVYFFNNAGTLVYTTTVIVPAYNRSVVALASLTSLPVGVYGGYVACDQNVAVSYTTWRAPVPGRMGAEAAQTVSNGPYVPLVFKDYSGINSNIIVMGQFAAQTVYADYYSMGGSLVRTDSQFVPAYGSVVFEPSGLAAGLYSVVLRSSLVQPLFNALHNWSQWGWNWGSYSGRGATTLQYLPQVMNGFFGYTTGISIFNPTANTVGVTVSYASGTFDSNTIAPYATWNIYPPNIPTWTVTSATVSSSGAVSVIANEVGPHWHGASYEALYSGVGMTYLPNFFKNYAGYGGYAQCQNTGSSTATITMTYSSGQQESDVADPGGYVGFSGSTLPNNWTGSAVASITGGNYVVCVVTADRSLAPFDTIDLDGRSLYQSIYAPSGAAYLPGLSQAAADGRVLVRGFHYEPDRCLTFTQTMSLYNDCGENYQRPENRVQAAWTSQTLAAWGEVDQPCTWNHTGDLRADWFIDETRCVNYVNSIKNQSKVWIIGNEPDGGVPGAMCWPGYVYPGDAQYPPDSPTTCKKYAKMYYWMRDRIKAWDPSALVVPAAWVYGFDDTVANHWPRKDGAFIQGHYDMGFGQVHADSFSWHYYNDGSNTTMASRLTDFLAQLQNAYSAGRTDTNRVRVTETAYDWRCTSGNDPDPYNGGPCYDHEPNGPKEVKYIQSTYPWLETQDRIVAGYYWAGDELLKNNTGNMLSPGQCYQQVARQPVCFLQ